MQGGRDPFFGFGDPFGNFGGGDGFGSHRSLISGFLGGRDPFDDPFFKRPFGSMFESSFFGPTGSPFFDTHASGLLEHQPAQPNRARGPIIEELNSDDDKLEKERGKEIKDNNPRKHGRSSKEPYVEYPDDESAEKKRKQMTQWNDSNQMHHVRSQPQTHSFTFQSSTVSYGGTNGAHYSTSRTRRTGSDGLTLEECKEANSSTRQATHRISRGIHDKGHSVTRKLKADGRVNTMQTLHNLNEDELVGFEEAWKGNVRKHLPGFSEEFTAQNAMGSGSSGLNSGRRALPSIGRSNNSERPSGSSFDRKIKKF
ncbi:glycine-rich protein [Forsythia ovata]|uniref:Glycine-rich protein n=1 Tax=Forsythia ovata TaxID=205694 RepID=A0ABD1W223_9LAMI